MKRFLAFVLTITLMLSAAAIAWAEEERTVPWPEIELEGVGVSLRSLGDESQRHQSWFGPGKQYAQSGAYKPYKATSVTALFREGDYILVDMDYQTAGRRCVYFRYSALSKNNVETMDLKSYPAKTTMLMIPLYGPGSFYELVTQTKPSPYADLDFATLASMFGGSYEISEALQDKRYSVYLEEGSDIDVFFETNHWVFAEFDCSLGLIRAWLPAEYVTAK